MNVTFQLISCILWCHPICRLCCAQSHMYDDQKIHCLCPQRTSWKMSPKILDSLGISSTFCAASSEAVPAVYCAAGPACALLLYQHQSLSVRPLVCLWLWPGVHALWWHSAHTPYTLFPTLCCSGHIPLIVTERCVPTKKIHLKPSLLANVKSLLLGVCKRNECVEVLM